MIELSFALFMLFGGFVVADNVPVLIWGQFVRYKPALAMKRYNGDEFIDILNEHITSDTITLVITEDDLSTEDLSQCKAPNGQTCFQGIQQVKSKLYLPSVKDPVRVMEDVAGLEKTTIMLLSNGSFSEPLNPQDGKYVFVKIAEDTSDQTKYTKLTRHDEVITKLYNELLKSLKIIVVFTGKRADDPKRFIRNIFSSQKNFRKVLFDDDPTTLAPTPAPTPAPTSAPTPTIIPTPSTPKPNSSKDDVPFGIFWKRKQLLMYYTELNLLKAPIVVDNVTVIESGNELRTAISANSGSDYLLFFITEDSGYWWVENLTWNGQPIYPDRRIYALNNFSFHCSPVIILTTRHRDVIINWKGLQLQPKFVRAEEGLFDSFGDSWDCVGFVSPPIISGLVVVLLMLFVFSIGISCILDIKTNDRFDDPNGKMIVFNVHE